MSISRDRNLGGLHKHIVLGSVSVYCELEDLPFTVADPTKVMLLRFVVFCLILSIIVFAILMVLAS